MVRVSNRGRARFSAPVQTDHGYRLVPGNKAAGAWRQFPRLSNAEVKERLELHLYSPSAFMAGYRVHFIFEMVIGVSMSMAKNEEIVAEFYENDNERVL